MGYFFIKIYINMDKKYLYKKDPNEIYECESCSDHVCNDECGCELSELAKESLKRELNNGKKK